MHVERKRQNKRQRRRNNRRRVITVQQLTSKPSTDEFQVARWVKTCFKMKTARFLNNQAQFFSASNLIDRLLNSGFAMGDCALFTNHQTFIDDPSEFYVWTYEPLYLEISILDSFILEYFFILNILSQQMI
ncbi:hypothetical protein DOY81_011793 [Sarcophaga bullata]|nr:hypothetical protein DOY81_011793 [Sarcophaga bullata]